MTNDSWARFYRNNNGFTPNYLFFDEAHVFVQHHTATSRPAPKRTVHAERVGPPELTDGVLRPTQVLWTWPMILDRLEPFRARYATLHQPRFDATGRLTDCGMCMYGPWPCADAEEILEYFGLTRRDLDYRPEDVRADADLVQGTRLRSAQAPR